MSKHTPGPWMAWHAGRTVEVVNDEGHNKPIVKWTGFDGCNRPLKEQIANARLIAAAPELLAAAELNLKAVELESTWLANQDVPGFDHNAAYRAQMDAKIEADKATRDVIAKAKGLTK